MNNQLFDEYLKGGYDDICDFETYKSIRLKDSSKLRKSFAEKMIKDFCSKLRKSFVEKMIANKKHK